MCRCAFLQKHDDDDDSRCYDENKSSTFYVRDKVCFIACESTYVHRGDSEC